MRLIHKPAIDNPEWKDAVADMINSSTQKEPTISPVPIVATEIVDQIKTKEENTKAAVRGPANKKSTLPDDEEKQMITKLYVENQMSVKEVAAEMGLSDTNIYDRLKKYGIPVRKKVKENTVHEEKASYVDEKKWQQNVIEMLKSGKTVYEIAQHYNMDKSTLYKKLNDYGIKPKMYKPR